MLPSWRKRLSVVLCRDRVGIVLLDRGWVQPKVIEKEILIPAQKSGEPIWRAPLATFAQWLDERALQGTAVHLTLTDDFVNYAVVPWSNEIHRESERILLAKACFESIHGAAAASWTIQIEDAQYEESSLACAVDGEMLLCVKELLQQKGLSINSMQSVFVRAANQYRKQLSESDSMLFVVGETVLTIVSRRGNEWFQALIRGIPAAEGLQGILQFAQREILLQGLPPATPVKVLCTNPARMNTFASGVAALLVSAPGLQASDKPADYPLNLAWF